MDRFKELQTFVAVAEAGGFNAAARRLQMSAPSVTRLVAMFEQRIGTRLFVRTTRQVALTGAGQRLFADALRILADLDAVEASAAGAHVEPQGVLTVTAPVNFGHRYVAPILRNYLDAYPAVSARTLFVDRIVNLIEEGLDVAVRIGELPDSSLMAVRVGAVRRVVVAAPSYTEGAGLPRNPEDLADHRLIVPSGLSPTPTWDFVSGTKRRVVNLQPVLTCNTINVAIDAAKSGWGITRVLSYQVAEALKSGELVELLDGFEDRRMPIHLMHSEGQLTAAKIRTFVDFAAQALRRHSEQLAAI